jgi:hypothetical protein
VLAAFTITNPKRVARPAGAPAPEECLHCGLDAPPLVTGARSRPPGAAGSGAWRQGS